MSDNPWGIDFNKPTTNDDYCEMSFLRKAYCALSCCNDVPVDEAFLAGMQD